MARKFMLTAINSGSEGGSICSKSASVVVHPKFSECLIDLLHPNRCEEISVDLEEEVSNSQLVLSLSTDRHSKKKPVILAHPEFCPIRKVNESPNKIEFHNEPRFSHIPVAVSVIVESVDNLVLLTRRASTLKAFPGVWVPPGGYVDPGETMADASIRELMEETGIKVNMDSAKLKTLALWESVYPPTLVRGAPKRHALVVYYLAKLQENTEKLNAKAKVSVGEVDMLGWFDKESVKAIVSASEDSKPPNSEHLTMLRVIPETDGLLESCEYPLVNLCKVLPEHSKEYTDSDTIDTSIDSDLDRVSTGTKYALKHWLNNS